MAVDIDQIVDSVDPPPADEIQIDNASGKGKLTAYARQRMTEVELLQWAGLDPRVWQVSKARTQGVGWVLQIRGDRRRRPSRC
jgi:hypothetical protein